MMVIVKFGDNTRVRNR